MTELNEMCELFCSKLCQDPLIADGIDLASLPNPWGMIALDLVQRHERGEPNDGPALWAAGKGKAWGVTALFLSDLPWKAHVTSSAWIRKNLKAHVEKIRVKRWLKKIQEDPPDVPTIIGQAMELGDGVKENEITTAESAWHEWKEGSAQAVLDLKTRLTNRWHLTSGGLHIVAGRTGMGKSRFLGYIAGEAARLDIPSLVISLEMSAPQVASYTGPRKNLWVFSRSLPVESLCSWVRLAKKRYGIKVVVVDYLQLVSTTKHVQSREQAVATVTRQLKSLALDEQLLILAGSQINRAVEQSSNKRPSLAHLRESGSIEQDSDSVALLYRSEYYLRLEGKAVPCDQQGGVEVILAKQRMTNTGSVFGKWEPKSNTWNWEVGESGF